MGSAAPNGMNIFPLAFPTTPLAPEFLQDTIVQLLELIAVECQPSSGGTAGASLTLAASATGTVTTVIATSSVAGTLSLPGVTSAGDTFVTLAATQTLTNKTITAPTLTGNTALGSAAGTVETIVDGGNVAVGTATGTQIGTSVTQKLGFWGVAPVVQQSVTSFSAATTTAATTAAGIYGFTTAAQPAGIISLLNQLRAIAVAEGLAVGP